MESIVIITHLYQHGYKKCCDNSDRKQYQASNGKKNKKNIVVLSITHL